MSPATSTTAATAATAATSVPRRHRAPARAAADHPADHPADQPAGDEGPPRSAADLDGLLRELSAYRLTLDAHLTVAAAAAQHGESAFATDLVVGERRRLADAEQRLLARLAEVELIRALGPLPLAALIPAPVEPPPRLRTHHARAVRAAPLVGAVAAAVAVLFGGGSLPSVTPHLTPVRSDSAIGWLTSLQDVAAHQPDGAQLIAASAKLHQALQPLITAAPTNRAAGEQALGLLTQERHLLQADHPAGSDTVLAATQRLVDDLSATLARTAQTVLAAPSAATGALGGALQLLHDPLGQLAERGAAGLGHPAVSASATPSASPTASPTASASAHPATPGPTSSVRPVASPAPVPRVLAPPIQHLLSLWQQLGLGTLGGPTTFHGTN